MIHPVVALSRLPPSVLQVGTLVAAHIASTTAAAAFGFAAYLHCASYCMPVWERLDFDGFRYLYERRS